MAIPDYFGSFSQAAARSQSMDQTRDAAATQDRQFQEARLDKTLSSFADRAQQQNQFNDRQTLARQEMSMKEKAQGLENDLRSLQMEKMGLDIDASREVAGQQKQMLRGADLFNRRAGGFEQGTDEQGNPTWVGRSAGGLQFDEIRKLTGEGLSPVEAKGFNEAKTMWEKQAVVADYYKRLNDVAETDSKVKGAVVLDQSKNLVEWKARGLAPADIPLSVVGTPAFDEIQTSVRQKMEGNALAAIYADADKFGVEYDPQKIWVPTPDGTGRLNTGYVDSISKEIESKRKVRDTGDIAQATATGKVFGAPLKDLPESAKLEYGSLSDENKELLKLIPVVTNTPEQTAQYEASLAANKKRMSTLLSPRGSAATAEGAPAASKPKYGKNAAGQVVVLNEATGQYMLAPGQK